MIEKKKISLPIAVEGKYDKNALLQIFDATVITLDGFGVFNSKEKQALIRKLSCDGIIVLTDSDGAGKVIRSFLNGIIPKDKIHNLYTKAMPGKERRKIAPSKEGLLGVEGVGRAELERVLEPFVVNDDGDFAFAKKDGKMITIVDFYADKLTGSNNSSVLRDRLAEYFDLPCGMTANALLNALNILTDLDGYRAAVSEIYKNTV